MALVLTPGPSPWPVTEHPISEDAALAAAEAISLAVVESVLTGVRWPCRVIPPVHPALTASRRTILRSFWQLLCIDRVRSSCVRRAGSSSTDFLLRTATGYTAYAEGAAYLNATNTPDTPLFMRTAPRDRKSYGSTIAGVLCSAANRSYLARWCAVPPALASFKAAVLRGEEVLDDVKKLEAAGESPFPPGVLTFLVTLEGPVELSFSQFFRRIACFVRRESARGL